MDEMECGNCGQVSIPKVYKAADKTEAWECTEIEGGCGAIYPPGNWADAEEEDEESEESDDAES